MRPGFSSQGARALQKQAWRDFRHHRVVRLRADRLHGGRGRFRQRLSSHKAIAGHGRPCGDGGGQRSLSRTGRRHGNRRRQRMDLAADRAGDHRNLPACRERRGRQAVRARQEPRDERRTGHAQIAGRSLFRGGSSAVRRWRSRAARRPRARSSSFSIGWRLLALQAALPMPSCPACSAAPSICR